jgi:hypothetical protein
MVGGSRLSNSREIFFSCLANCRSGWRAEKNEKITGKKKRIAGCRVARETNSMCSALGPPHNWVFCGTGQPRNQVCHDTHRFCRCVVTDAVADARDESESKRTVTRDVDHRDVRSTLSMSHLPDALERRIMSYLALACHVRAKRVSTAMRRVCEWRDASPQVVRCRGVSSPSCSNNTANNRHKSKWHTRNVSRRSLRNLYPNGYDAAPCSIAIARLRSIEAWSTIPKANASVPRALLQNRFAPRVLDLYDISLSLEDFCHVLRTMPTIEILCADAQNVPAVATRLGQHLSRLVSLCLYDICHHTHRRDAVRKQTNNRNQINTRNQTNSRFRMSTSTSDRDGDGAITSRDVDNETASVLLSDGFANHPRDFDVRDDPCGDWSLLTRLEGLAVPVTLDFIEKLSLVPLPATLTRLTLLPHRFDCLVTPKDFDGARLFDSLPLLREYSGSFTRSGKIPNVFARVNRFAHPFETLTITCSNADADVDANVDENDSEDENEGADWDDIMMNRNDTRNVSETVILLSQPPLIRVRNLTLINSNARTDISRLLVDPTTVRHISCQNISGGLPKHVMQRQLLDLTLFTALERLSLRDMHQAIDGNLLSILCRHLVKLEQLAFETDSCADFQYVAVAVAVADSTFPNGLETKTVVRNKQRSTGFVDENVTVNDGTVSGVTVNDGTTSDIDGGDNAERRDVSEATYGAEDRKRLEPNIPDVRIAFFDPLRLLTCLRILDLDGTRLDVFEKRRRTPIPEPIGQWSQKKTDI